MILYSILVLLLQYYVSPYIFLFIQAPILVWVDSTIIDINYNNSCGMLGYDWWLCMMVINVSVQYRV